MQSQNLNNKNDDSTSSISSSHSSTMRNQFEANHKVYQTKENFQIGHLEVSDNLDVIAEVAVYFDSL